MTPWLVAADSASQTSGSQWRHGQQPEATPDEPQQRQQVEPCQAFILRYRGPPPADADEPTAKHHQYMQRILASFGPTWSPPRPTRQWPPVPQRLPDHVEDAYNHEMIVQLGSEQDPNLALANKSEEEIDQLPADMREDARRYKAMVRAVRR